MKTTLLSVINLIFADFLVLKNISDVVLFDGKA